MTLLLPRRAFLGVLAGALAAPIVCKAEWLMPVRQLIAPASPTLAQVMEIILTDGIATTRWIAAPGVEYSVALAERELLPQFRHRMNMASPEYQEVLIGCDAKGKMLYQGKGLTCYLNAADS